MNVYDLLRPDFKNIKGHVSQWKEWMGYKTCFAWMFEWNSYATLKSIRRKLSTGCTQRLALWQCERSQH